MPKKLLRKSILSVSRMPHIPQIAHFRAFIGFAIRRSIIMPTTLMSIVDAVEISS